MNVFHWTIFDACCAWRRCFHAHESCSGCSCACFHVLGSAASPTGVTSNASKLLPVEVQDDSGNYHDFRDSSEYSCATSGTFLNGAYDFVFGVKSSSVQTTFSMRSATVPEDLLVFFLLAARHPADSDGLSNRWCPGTGQGTKGTMASVPLWASTALQSAVSL